MAQALFSSNACVTSKTRVKLEAPQAHIKDGEYFKLVEEFGDKVQISAGHSQWLMITILSSIKTHEYASLLADLSIGN